MAARVAKSAKSPDGVDVMVVGEHPSAYLAAALLARGGKLKVLHAPMPRKPSAVDERLVRLNPALFDLSPLLAEVRRKLEQGAVFGLQFLSDTPGVCSQYRAKSAAAYVARYAAVRAALAELAAGQGARCLSAKSITFLRVDETGLDATVGTLAVRARMLVLSDPLPPAQRDLLRLQDGWGLARRYTHLRCKQPTSKPLNLGERPVAPMSLHLNGTNVWASLLSGEGEFQLTVEQPAGCSAESAEAALRHWADLLHAHGVLREKLNIAKGAAFHTDVPTAAALENEGVGNRTLLIGPAGGFYSDCGEDIYPNCWSTLFAEKVIRNALREPHLQDALHPYRQIWRTSLGAYLRGPRENLQFLLPLLYKNSAITTRLAEAILFGKSVVR